MIKFIKLIHDIDGAIECLPMIIVHLVSLTKYLNWILNANKLKTLFALMERDGEILEVDQDIKIMEDWLERIRSVGATYTTGIFSVLGTFLVSPAIPKIMDIINPLNESRPLINLYETEYFVDQQKYYLYILLHAYMTVPISVAVLVYFDILLGTHVYHACAMFKILRSYLETIHLDIHNITDRDQRKSEIINRKIIHCITIHKNTLEFTDELESSYSTAWLIMLTLCTFVITLTGTVAVMKLDKPMDAIKYISFSSGNVCHLYYTTFQGQQLIEESTAVFHSAYFSDWYNIPPQYQRLLIPIMIRSMAPCKISAGNIFILSMDLFSSVIQKAMSFFTLLSSMR
ncbi:odorant receptor Or2-like isoform X2 [Microplitis mediator]|nr:odorant receptor Or2-like isoform X2 [Microplitis mediator]